MRRLCLLGLVGLSMPLGCADDPPGGIEVSVERAQLDVTPGQPDANAELDITVEVQTRGQPEDVTLGEVTITTQPVTEDSESMTFDARLVNPQGDDPIVRLAAGEAIVVRVLNNGTLNSAIEPWCARPVQLSVSLMTAQDEQASGTASISVRCP